MGATAVTHCEPWAPFAGDHDLVPRNALDSLACSAGDTGVSDTECSSSGRLGCAAGSTGQGLMRCTVAVTSSHPALPRGRTCRCWPCRVCAGQATLCGTVSHGHVHQGGHAGVSRFGYKKVSALSAAAWPSELLPPAPGSTGDQRGLTNLGLVDATTIEVCCRAGGRTCESRAVSSRALRADVCHGAGPGWRSVWRLIGAVGLAAA